MPRASATPLVPPAGGGVRIIPMLSGVILLAGLVLAPGAGFAEGGYARRAPSSHGDGPPPRAHRCGPPHPACHARGPSMPPAVVRAYLPRNDALPMYNEPPPHFPQR